MRWILFDLIGKYGTSYSTVFSAMIFAILSYSGLYYLFGLDVTVIDFISDSSSYLEKMFGYIYYSGITFFTVGYGEITPNSTLTAAIAVIESFTGVFLMSYFVVAFARKVIR